MRQYRKMAIPNTYEILQAVIEATPDAIFVKDLEGCYVLVNEAAARFLGRSPAEIIGKHDLELYPEETARRFIEDDKLVVATGRAQSFEGIASSAVGQQAYLVTKGVYRDKDGKILGLYGISHDITELQAANESLAQTREALYRSQKMEAVGQLTGGIAHDFNNILVVILGNLELLKMRLRDDVNVHELIDPVMRATQRGQELIAQLLAFSRGRQLNPELVDVNHIADTITSPDLITQDAVDSQRLVYYRTYQAQPQRWMKVVVEQEEIVTAYRVRRLKQGETIQWQR